MLVRLLAALCAVTVMVGPGVSGPAGAADDGPAPRQHDGTGNPTLTLVEQTAVVEAGGILRLVLEVDGELPPEPEPAPADPPATTDPATTDPTTTDPATTDPGDEVPPPVDPATVPAVVVTSHEPVQRRDQLASMRLGAVGPALDGARFALADVLVPADTSTDPAVPAQLVLDVTTTTGGDVAAELELPLAGLYPVTVDLVVDGRRLARHITFVERLTAPGDRPARTRAFHLAIVAGIDDPGPEPTELELVDARARVLEVEQLGAALASPLSLVIPPVVARAATTDDPELAARLVATLAGDELLAVPETVLDPSAAVAAGEVEAFTRELREGEDVLADAIPSAATRRTARLVTEQLSTAGAAMLRDLGVQLLVMPLDDYHALDGALPPAFTDPSLLYTAALADDTAIGVAVVDPVSALLDPDRPDGGDATATAIDVFAELTATRLQLPDATRVAILSTPGLGIPDADVLTELERMVAGHPDLRFQPLSFVSSATDVFELDGEPVSVTLPASAGPDLRARSSTLATARLEVATVASMLPDDDPRPGAWNSELDLLLSTSFTDAEVASRVNALEAEVTAIPSSIVPPEPFTFTLTGETSELSFRIGNTGATPLTVVIHSAASKLEFPDGDATVTLLPGPNVLEIPVRSRSNGTFPVEIELRTPAGAVTIGEPIVLTARVSALTGLGQLLTGGALLVLVSWWFSHLRGRRRRGRRGGASDVDVDARDPSDRVAAP